ncbi:MAG: LapA family protein [Pseudomonadota bacterium]
MKIFTYLCALLLILIGVSFSLLNAGTVTVNYLLGSKALPISFLIIISIALGALFSLFFCGLNLLKQKATIHNLKRKNESLEKTVSNLSIGTKT